MFLSMTGFANKTVNLSATEENKLSLYIEIKTINSRYFECSCKLPSMMSSLEIPIIQKCKSKLLRGRVYLTIRLLEESEIYEKIIPGLNLVKEYVKATEKIKSELNLPGKITINDILNLPNIFSSRQVIINKKIEKSILEEVDKILNQVKRSRSVEGTSLKKDLEKRFEICSKKISTIKKLFKKLIKAQKEKIKQTLAIFEKGDEESKLKLDELYSTINKIDINEEIIRFESHIKNIKKVVKDANQEKGKRLDFILQELLRESNTILAKCSSFDISAYAVDIKVELEKIREQAQNIV